MNKKKIGLIILAFVGIVLFAMIVLPVVFKSNIINKVKQMANESLQARLDFKEVDISLFRSFPQLDVRINDLSINGINEFEGKKLFGVQTLSTSVSISSLWKSEGITVSEIVLQNPQIILLVTPTGKANWDITKPSTGVGTVSVKKSPLKIALSKIELNNTSLSYQDDQSGLVTQLKSGNFLLSGFLQGSDTKLNFKGSADSISLNYSKNQLLSGLKVSGEGALQANFDQMNFKFLGNKFQLNRLPLELQGTFIMGEKSDQYDLTFNSTGASLDELLSFLPASQQQKLKGYEKGGNLAFSGMIKGTYSDQTFPAVKANLNLSQGRLKYPSLPNEISKITISAGLEKPQGVLDSLKIAVSKFEASIAGHPIMAEFNISTPVSNPSLSGGINGEVDLATLKQTIALDSMETGGLIKANIKFNGSYAAIEKGDYDKFQTRGDVTIKDFFYRSPMFPDRLGIQSAGFVFNPKDVTVSSMKGKLGVSDFTVDGSFSNYWAYILKDGTLQGNIKFKSDLLDVTQLMNGGKPSADTTHSEPMVLPARIDLTVQADVNTVHYSRMDIKGMTGKLVVRDQKLTLDQLSMNLLKGKMVVSGLYSCKLMSPADFNFKLDIKDFDLPTAYQSVGAVRHLLPIAGNSKGTFLTGMNISGTLGTDYAPNFGSLNGAGLISLKNIELVGNNMFAEIGKYFRKDLFTNVKVNDFAGNITINNGALTVAPFTTKIANQEVTISGTQSLSLDLNYQLKFKVNKSDLSSDVSGLIGFVPGTENIDKYPIGINVVGKIAKPEVKIDLSEAKDLVAKEFSKKANSTLKDVAKKFGLENLFK
ncbi:MAG: AsmA-like C-terminal region-containing protein [Prolixibacteraceae bacterium]